MLIAFYHISLCPRCARARKHLQDLLGNSYAAAVIEINVISHPVKAKRNNIKMVPAIKYGDNLLSGVFLSHQSIRQFLEGSNLLDTERSPSSKLNSV